MNHDILDSPLEEEEEEKLEDFELRTIDIVVVEYLVFGIFLLELLRMGVLFGESPFLGIIATLSFHLFPVGYTWIWRNKSISWEKQKKQYTPISLVESVFGVILAVFSLGTLGLSIYLFFSQKIVYSISVLIMGMIYVYYLYRTVSKWAKLALLIRRSRKNSYE